MTTRRQLLLGWLCGLLLAGCGAVPPTTSPTASPTGPDFTAPGAARAMLAQLLAKAGSQRALMVEVTRTTVQVSVLDDDRKPVTWAYRDGEVGEVASDLQYVDQATFDVSRFNLSDVGGLFRAAEGQSGSNSSQSLTIVDYSGGEVTMSVSTIPESRTVFFNADGSLLETLNFEAPGGIARGIKDAVGTRALVYSVTVDSSQGAWADYPGDDGTTVRRTRTSKVPATINVMAQQVDLPQFFAVRIDAEAIWKVLASVRGTADVPRDAAWSVVIDDRERLGVARMYFRIGPKVLVTTLDGHVISG